MRANLLLWWSKLCKVKVLSSTDDKHESLWDATNGSCLLKIFIRALSNLFHSCHHKGSERKMPPCLGNCFSCLTSFCLSWLCFLRKNQLIGMDACQQLQPWLCSLFHSLITWVAFNIIDESSDYALGAGLLPHPVMWTEGRLRRLQSLTVLTCPSQCCYNTGQAEYSWLVCKLQNKYL